MGSFNTREDAEQAAQGVKARLGEEWEIKVWDNLGWTYSVSLDDSIYVYPASVAEYHVMIGKGGSMLAFLSPTDGEDFGDDPVKLVEDTVNAYKANLDAFVAQQYGLLACYRRIRAYKSKEA